MKDIHGKRAVVTGAGSGLGRALTLALAERGCRVAVADINLEAARETLAKAQERKGTGEVYRLDVTRPEEVERLAEHLFKNWGGVDLLVNNAGIAVVGLVGDVAIEDWRRVVDVNFWGMVYGCHSFIPRMKTQGGGHILNVASAAGLLSMMEMAPYSATKAAIVSLSETLKVELAPHRIGVTVLCPMFFKTGLLDTMTYTEEFEKELSHACFEHGRMTAEQVAESAIRAVEKDRLYCVPQASGKLLWFHKRMCPSSYYSQTAFLHRRGWARPLFLWLGRHGLL